MDESERDSPAENHGESASTALANLVDPVVAVHDGTIAVANGAARDAFDLPRDVDGVPAARALGGIWESIEAVYGDVPAGTVRTVSLADERFDARIHRGVDGATITFDRVDRSPPEGDHDQSPSRENHDQSQSTRLDDSPARDLAVKDRAMNEAPVGITITDPSRPDNPLVYVNDAFERVTGYPTAEILGRNCRFLQGEDTDPETVAAMREAIDDARPVTVEIENERRDGTPFWNEVTIAPVRDGDGTVTHYVGFQNDVTARKEAEFEAERATAQVRAERAELERVLERVEGLVQDVTARVAGASSRTALESSVCERLVAEPSYAAAWIGAADPSSGAVTVRTSAGAETATRIEVGETVTDDDDHPATGALPRGAPAIDRRDGETVAAFPLAYNDVEYGVLVVHAEDADDAGEREPVDDHEAVILSALARAIASGINARETSRIIETDAVVAVEVDLEDDAVVPVALSARAECELEYHRSISRNAETSAALFTARGVEMDELVRAAADLDVEVRPIVERSTDCLVEIATDEPSLVTWLSDRGSATRSIAADSGRARVTFEVPESGDVRSIVDALEVRHPGTTVRSIRRRERAVETRQEFAARIEETLTDRQLGVLQRAYHAGYFEWPRPTTGEELAASMGISRPTFHEHLRMAELKLCRALFEGE